ncbi:acylneuraminate cytidylyltransferase family protein [Chryseobacterium sp. MYb264]|uniref:acylneuraminate cytidylyltransferase family protein n=1 Tax=Chryseobacterium sp. MYb264 TaxID=2745153 RepID=UPI002E163DA8|nr:acylneuraminate cytidylyltransferase family protein [Chryseobacterium sp. MYb264]
MTEKETLVIIPARGGSKGVPKKNIKDLLGKPLIQYTLDFAVKYYKPEDICVSTDSEEIREVVQSLGYTVPFLRPDELASDYSGSREVIIHAIEYYKKQGIHYKNILLLQPTSPVRNEQTMKDILKMAGNSDDYDMIVSVKTAKSNPYFNLFEEDENGYLAKSKQGDFTRRQDCPIVYEYNGAFYYISTDRILKHNISDFERVIKIVDDKAIYNIDIDTMMDWKMTELIMEEYNLNN